MDPPQKKSNEPSALRATQNLPLVYHLQVGGFLLGVAELSGAWLTILPTQTPNLKSVSDEGSGPSWREHHVWVWALYCKEVVMSHRAPRGGQPEPGRDWGPRIISVRMSPKGDGVDGQALRERREPWETGQVGLRGAAGSSKGSERGTTVVTSPGRGG